MKNSVILLTIVGMAWGFAGAYSWIVPNQLAVSILALPYRLAQHVLTPFPLLNYLMPVAIGGLCGYVVGVLADEQAY